MTAPINKNQASHVSVSASKAENKTEQDLDGKEADVNAGNALRQKALITERVAKLTQREKDVYALMAVSVPTSEIAARLGMKRNTAENYRNRVNRVLGFLAPWLQQQGKKK